MKVQPKRGESDYDRMIKIGRIAIQRSKQSPEFYPVKLVLKRNIPTRLGTFDMFNLLTDDGSNNPNARLSIKRHDETHYADPVFSTAGISFVLDEDSFSMFTYVPKTQHNMACLASHYDELWYIADDVVDPEVKKMYELLPKDREANRHQSIDADAMKIKEDTVAENKRLKDELATLRALVGNVSKSNVEKETPAPKTEDASIIRERAKKLLKERDGIFVSKCQIKAKNYWLLPEYRERIDSIMEELKGVPA